MKNVVPFAIFSLLLTASTFGQLVIRPDSIEVTNDLPVFVSPIASDSLASSFVIVVDKEVKAHFHEVHTEYVYVISGTAKMTLGEVVYDISPGDLIYIPRKMPHSVEVTSDIPLRVISIQTPEFKGKDRIFVRPSADQK